MPRVARVKSEDSIFHVMARSISEVDLFKDNEDKIAYLELIKRYKTIFCFKVYGFCLMDNHLHMIIDANGADISTIMHSINFAYAMYFNSRHGRHGHLFQDRFKSKVVTTERYLLTLSAYIHHNPMDLPGYKKCPEKYVFSTLHIYLGLSRDPYGIVDESFILGLIGGDSKVARKNYLSLVHISDDKKLKAEMEFEKEVTEYRSLRRILVRNKSVDEILNYVASSFEISVVKLKCKYCRGVAKARAVLVFMMRSLCNYKCGDICNLLGNITQGRVSALSSIAIELMDEGKYRNIVEGFLYKFCA